MQIVGRFINLNRQPQLPGFYDWQLLAQEVYIPNQNPEPRFDDDRQMYYVSIPSRSVDEFGNGVINYMGTEYFDSRIQARWTNYIMFTLNNAQAESVYGFEIDDLQSMFSGTHDYTNPDGLLSLPKVANLNNHWYRNSAGHIIWALREKLFYDIDAEGITEEPDLEQDILNLTAIFSRVFLENTYDFAQRNREDYRLHDDNINPELIHPEFAKAVERYLQR